MNVALVQDAATLPRLVVNNTPRSLRSTTHRPDLADNTEVQKLLDELGGKIDFVCASQPIFEAMVDELESTASKFTEPADVDGKIVDGLENLEKAMKKLLLANNARIDSLTTISGGNLSQIQKRFLKQTNQFVRTIESFIRNLQRYRWLILSIDGGLANPSGRAFDNAEEFVNELLKED